MRVQDERVDVFPLRDFSMGLSEHCIARSVLGHLDSKCSLGEVLSSRWGLDRNYTALSRKIVSARDADHCSFLDLAIAGAGCDHLVFLSTKFSHGHSFAHSHHHNPIYNAGHCGKVILMVVVGPDFPERHAIQYPATED